MLRGINLEIKPAQYVALVGPSGCGKSTIVSLIERFDSKIAFLTCRFYDPVVGEILVDYVPVSAYNLSEYRRNISIVSQEPTYSLYMNFLTGDSIKERFDLISF